MSFEPSSAGNDIHSLNRILARVRARWRLRRAATGFALLLCASPLVLMGSALLLDFLRFAEPAVITVRVLAYFSLAALAVGVVVLPLLQRVGDDRLALYLEEHEPELGGVVVSAVEMTRSRPQGVSPSIIAGLVQRAVESCRGVEMGDRVERRGLRRAAVALAGAMLAILTLVFWAPPLLDTGLRALLSPWGDPAEANPYLLTVQPGDAEVVRGDDLAIGARSEGFEPAYVDLLLRRPGGEWKRRAMTGNDDPGNHGVFLFDLKGPVEYRVDADGVESETFYVTVVERPEVRRISLEYRYPEYTGRPMRKEEDGGPISAPFGTVVRLAIEANTGISTAALELADQTRLPLSRAPDGTWVTELNVKREDLYRVIMEATNGETVPASPHYPVQVLKDTPR